jgi:DDE superfamily endonuclease
MSAQPWNTIAERNILIDLMELLLQEMDKENVVEADNLDDYLMDFWEGDDMDVDDPIEDLVPIEDLDFREEEPFDLIGDLLLMMVVYGEYILEDLQSNVQFNTQHLRIDLLSEVKCVDSFQFRKEDLSTLFKILQKPMGTVLEFVARSADQVQVKYLYTAPYETGLLMIFILVVASPQSSKQHGRKVWSASGLHFCCCSMFIDALYTIVLPYLTNTGLFHHQFPVYAEKIAGKTGNTAINVWGFIDRTLKKTCWPTYFQKAAYSGHKHCHGIKFQNVTMPDGYLADLYGPIAGCRHDSYMLASSKLLCCHKYMH